MARRTTLRLDGQAEQDLAYLASKLGTQTAAVKAALALLARSERLRDRTSERLVTDAGQATLDELFSRINQHTDGNADLICAAEVIRADRDSK